MCRKSNKSKLFFILTLFLPLFSPADSSPHSERQQTETSENLLAGYPSKDGIIIDRAGYALCYSEEHEQACWVSYRLTKDEVLNKVVSRTDNFREDPLISSGSAALSDYRFSGFDRGHLAPAGDMGWCKTAMSESFYMSNMSPQDPSFNRGIWKNLEELIREWAVDNEEVWVVTGPVLNGKFQKTIGTNKVTVPLFFYKVILDCKKPELKAIGFILPNEGSRRSLIEFAVTVDKVEQVTGLDFFSRLPDKIEIELESNVDVSLWDWTVSDSTAPIQRLVKSNPVRGSPTVEDTDHENQVIGKGEYWLNTKSNVRHNIGCRYYRKTKYGRPCGPDEGKACGICGG